MIDSAVSSIYDEMKEIANHICKLNTNIDTLRNKIAVDQKEKNNEINMLKESVNNLERDLAYERNI